MVVGMGGCVQKARKLHVHTGRRESLLRVNSLEKSCPLSSSKRRAPLGCGLSGGRRPIRSRRALGGTWFPVFLPSATKTKQKHPLSRASVFSWPHIYILKSEYSGGGGRCEKWLQSSPFESPAAFRGPLPCCKGEYSAPFCLQSLTEVLYLFSLLFEKKLSSCLRRSSLQIDFTFLLQKMFPWNENVMNVRSLACSCQAIPLIQFRMHLLESLFLDFCSCFLLCLDHLYICTSQFLLHQSS